MKQKPQRTCIVCRQPKEKNELFRIVRSKEGEITLDPTGRKNGRGAYICRNADCLEKLIKNHGLERAFERAVSQETYEQILADATALLNGGEGA